MAELLSLRGRTALSPFRITKLLQSLSAAHSAHRITGVTTTFWHFVEISRALAENERDKLDRLLTYGPHVHSAAPDGAMQVTVSGNNAGKTTSLLLSRASSTGASCTALAVGYHNHRWKD